MINMKFQIFVFLEKLENQDISLFLLCFIVFTLMYFIVFIGVFCGLFEEFISEVYFFFLFILFRGTLFFINL